MIFSRKLLLTSSILGVALSLAALSGCSDELPEAAAERIAPVKIAPTRLGVCSWSYRLPMDQVATEMSKAKVEGIHLALAPFIAADERHGGAEDAEALAAVKDRIEKGEWKLFSTMLSFPQEDYTTLESIRRTGGIVPDECWAKNQELVKAAVKLTEELGAKYLSLHAGFLDESDPAAYAKYVQRVSWMRDACQQKGVMLLLESGQETAEDLVKFMAAVPGIGINFDPANMVLYGKGDPVKAVPLLAKWIRQVHIKDAKFTKEPGTWGEEVPWGEGDVQAQAFLRALTAAGYRGNYVIEREGGDQRSADIARAIARCVNGK